MASALAQDTESTPSGRAPHSLEMAGSRTLAYIALGPRGSWFTRWSDGHTVWEGIPATLHTKLHGRSSQLPHVRSLSMLGQSEWVVVFDDGSICSSGFGLFGRLTAELDACQVKCLVLAPACGWLLVRLDGSVSYERLPTGLSGLLERRTSIDPPIDQVCISGVGAWFVRFTDGECLWNGLPDVFLANSDNAGAANQGDSTR